MHVRNMSPAAYVYIYVYICIYVYVCVYVNKYIYIYIHICAKHVSTFLREIQKQRLGCGKPSAALFPKHFLSLWEKKGREKTQSTAAYLAFVSATFWRSLASDRCSGATPRGRRWACISLKLVI